MLQLSKLNIICVCAVLLCSCTQTPKIPSINGWRGINRDGIYNEKDLLTSWGDDGPQLLWFVETVGKGFSSPVVLNDKIFTTGLDDEETKEVFSAYTLKGNLLYQVIYGTAFTKSFPGTRTTPTIVENRAYMVSSQGETVCINTDDGTILWSVDGEKTFAREYGKWGSCESLLVIDNKVIYSPGGKQTTVVALDTETGETVWMSKSLEELGSYTSPLLISHNGKKQIIGFTEYKMFGINPDNGDFEWTFKDWNFEYKDGMDGICANTPIYADGKVFVSNAYNMQSFMFELNNDATDISLVWRNLDFGVHTGGMVLVNGVIYGSNFFSNSKGNWMAVDWNTGETKYKTDSTEWKTKGPIIAANNLLFCCDERQGTMGLVNANPEKFEVISEFKIPHGEGPFWAHPAISNGVLYIRHGQALMAYKI